MVRARASAQLAPDSQELAGLQCPAASSGQKLSWVDLQAQLAREFFYCCYEQECSTIIELPTSAHHYTAWYLPHARNPTWINPSYPPLGFLILQSESFCGFPSTPSWNNSPVSSLGSALPSAGGQTYFVIMSHKWGCFLANHLP